MSRIERAQSLEGASLVQRHSDRNGPGREPGWDCYVGTSWSGP
jgi:hypothetical protein